MGGGTEGEPRVTLHPSKLPEGMGILGEFADGAFPKTPLPPPAQITRWLPAQAGARWLGAGLAGTRGQRLCASVSYSAK